MSVRDRYEGIQTVLLNCGNYGCNFLSLLSIAEDVTSDKLDILNVYKESLLRGFVTDDFYVNSTLGLLHMLTGRNWKRSEVEEITHQLKDNEYSIAVYYNPATGYTHFRRRAYDTLEYSKTVEEGYIKKYYIYQHD